MGKEGLEKGDQDTVLRGTCAKGQAGGGIVA